MCAVCSQGSVGTILYALTTCSVSMETSGPQPEEPVPKCPGAPQDCLLLHARRVPGGRGGVAIPEQVCLLKEGACRTSAYTQSALDINAVSKSVLRNAHAFPSITYFSICGGMSKF